MSLVNQTYENTEIIVIDDGSTDSTPEILERLAGKYNFTFIQQENRGLTRTLNRIIGMAKGKYIAGCASDDYVPLDKIEKQVNFMERNDEFAVCGGNVTTVDRDGSVITKSTPDDNSVTIINFEDVFLYNKSIPAGTALIRRDVLEEVGGYSAEYPIEDKYMWLKITNKGYKIARMNCVLQYYRQHDNNISRNFEFMIDNVKKCLDLYKSHSLYPRAISNFHAQIFNDYAVLSKKHSINAFFKIRWWYLDKETLKVIVLGILKHISFK